MFWRQDFSSLPTAFVALLYSSIVLLALFANTSQTAALSRLGNSSMLPGTDSAGRSKSTRSTTDGSYCSFVQPTYGVTSYHTYTRDRSRSSVQPTHGVTSYHTHTRNGSSGRTTHFHHTTSTPRLGTGHSTVTSLQSTASAVATPDSAILASWTSACDIENGCTGNEIITSFRPGKAVPMPCSENDPQWTKSNIILKEGSRFDPKDMNLRIGPFTVNKWEKCYYETVYSRNPTKWGSVRCDGMSAAVPCSKAVRSTCTGGASYVNLGVCRW